MASGCPRSKSRRSIGSLRDGQIHIAAFPRRPSLRETRAYTESDDEAWRGYCHDPIPALRPGAILTVIAWTPTRVIQSTVYDGILTWIAVPRHPPGTTGLRREP